MLKTTVGYPDLHNLAHNSMSLETAGVVSTPNFFTGDGLERQKEYFAKGFQGLGFDLKPSLGLEVPGNLDPVSAVVGAVAGGGSLITLALVGMGVFALSKFFGAEETKKRARRSYEREVSQVAAKYAKYGI
jgi:hypothetical protein